MYSHLMQPKPVEGWATAPRNLGELIADEVFRVCQAREMVDPLKLTHDEQKRILQAVEAWEPEVTSG